MYKDVELGAVGTAYIRDQLQVGMSLAHYLKKLPLELGKVMTSVPVTMVNKDIMNLYQGLLPETDEHWKERLAQHIKDVLSKSTDTQFRYAIFENLVAATTSPWLKNAQIRFFTNHSSGEIYHLLTSNDSNMDIYNSLFQVRSSYEHGIICQIDSELNIAPLRAVADETFQYLAQHTTHIFTSAYDGEGYVTWTKSAG
jgi:hypothetical protein